MKPRKIILALAGLALLIPITAAQAADTGCRNRQMDLEREISAARMNDNHRLANRLEATLAQVRGECGERWTSSRHEERWNDSSSNERWDNSRNDQRFINGKTHAQIMQKERLVRQREMQLEQARLRGDSKSIARYERQLRDARQELSETEYRYRDWK